MHIYGEAVVNILLEMEKVHRQCVRTKGSMHKEGQNMKCFEDKRIC